MNLSTKCVDCLTSSRVRPNTAGIHTGSNISTAIVHRETPPHGAKRRVFPDNLPSERVQAVETSRRSSCTGQHKAVAHCHWPMCRPAQRHGGRPHDLPCCGVHAHPSASVSDARARPEGECQVLAVEDVDVNALTVRRRAPRSSSGCRSWSGHLRNVPILPNVKYN